MIILQEITEVSHGFCNFFRFGQHDNAEMIRLVPAEASAGDYHDIFAVKIVHGKLLVIGYVEFFDIKLRKNVEGGAVFNKGYALNFFKLAAGRLALLIKAAAGHNHGTGAVGVSQGGRNNKLHECVCSKAHGTKTRKACDEILGALFCTTDNHPAAAKATDDV